jgi:hypothetical protein
MNCLEREVFFLDGRSKAAYFSVKIHETCLKLVEPRFCITKKKSKT